MLTILRLKIRNFMSFGNNITEIDLNSVGTTLIIGEDLDNTTMGVVKNGVGKSTILQALSYALYDRPMANIKIDNLVNNINKKDMEITIEFEKDGVSYKVERKRKSGKSERTNSVTLFISGEDKTPDSIKNTNIKIETILGLTYDMFVRMVVVTSNHVPFFDLPVTHTSAPSQSSFMERLFDLTILSEKAESLKEVMKRNDESIKIQKIKVDQFEREHEKYVQQVKNTKLKLVSWEDTTSRTITELQEKLDMTALVDFEREQKLHKQVSKLNDQTSRYATEISAVESELKRKTKRKGQLDTELSHLSDSNCPYCLQEFKDVAQKIKDCKAELIELVSDILLMEQSVVDLQLVLTNARTKKNDILSQLTVNNIEELLEVKNQTENILQRIADLKNAENPFVDVVEDFIKFKPTPIDYTQLNELTRLYDHQQFLYKLLTKKDSFVRKSLLNKNLPFLNARLHHYLGHLGMVHRVLFTHEMTADIELFGRTLEFGNLSNGQKARVNIALSFAFRDILQKLHCPVNIAIYDEIFDSGLDDVGVQSAARLLKLKASEENLSMYIISHREELMSSFDQTMTVQMYKGFSQIKESVDDIVE